VQARVAQLTLRLPADAADAEVSLDGRRLAPAVVGKPAPIDPGRHRVKVTASQNRVAELDLELREGEQRTVHVVLRAAVESAATPPASAPPAAPPEKTASAPAPASAKVSASQPAGVDSSRIGTREWVLIGEGTAALVGLGVGIGYLAVRSEARERVETAQSEIDALAGGSSSGSCASADFAGRAACNDLEAAIADYDRAGVIATVGFVGAGVAGVATALTFVLWKPEKRPALSMGPGPGLRGLSVSGSF
ncbi:MAG TPA: hypothetical protein VM686_28820, partial [Polyangiaceae bacterium]|nr:hypothetical protein [Polyangiaceae bacterium]